MSLACEGEEEWIQDFGRGEEDNIKLDFKETEWEDLDWIYVTSGAPFWTRHWRLELYKLRLIFWMAEQLPASEGGFCFMDWPNITYNMFRLKNPLDAQNTVKC